MTNRFNRPRRADRGEIVSFYAQRGLQLVRLKTCARRHGCNEYVFTRSH